MATKAFGTHDTENSPAPRNYAAELYKLVGVNFPLSLSVDVSGKLTGASYETTWQEGNTEPVVNDDGETEFKENYEKQKLTKDQIKSIDGYLAENVTLQS